MKVRKIEITFPDEVDITFAFDRMLANLTEMMCDKYKEENPHREMWVSYAGQGWRRDADGTIIGFEDSVFTVTADSRTL